MQHITLYRKYRPKDFEEIAGQKEIVRTLKASLRSGKISHAYLFTGPRGLGKTTIARLIAKGVNCLAHEGFTDEPCNTCDNCVAINEGNFIDLVEIDAASNRGIDEIRQIKEKINYQPSSGRKKIYIIDEAHMLTKEAFNALLKTLEEPPDHVIFILATTEPDKVLPTIISRCQRYDFKTVVFAEMRQRLEYIAKEEAIDLDEDVYAMIYESAGGGMRDAISILERLMITCYGEKITVERCEQTLGVTPAKKMKDFLDIVLGGNLRDATLKLDEYWLESLEVELFFKDFAKYCKNLMSKNELPAEDGLHIIGAVYDGLNKFKYEEDKRLVGYVIADRIMNSVKEVEIREKIIERVEEKVVAAGGGQGGVDPDISLSLEEIRTKWNDILNAAKKEKPTYRAILRSARPYRVDRNVLYISFSKDDAYSKGLMEQRSYGEPFLQIVRNRIHPGILLHYVVAEPEAAGKKKPEKNMGDQLADFFENGDILIE
ncbi:MAG: DNA polymerase III subunit gamma/tau [Fusobacteriaceae bacterium]|jgi:DNA polymerase-3 subunit gamma/tau|nr:DNA polymerase III subunit gamma/tau [Fusobacteriaceae bacterium]